MEYRPYLEIVSKHPEFFGIRRFCNICGYRFSKFVLFNRLHPREAMCPRCGSLERHRHLYIYIAALFPFLKGKSILHFAPENILKDIFLQSEAEYVDADLDPAHATYQVDITKIAFENNKFDYIFCNHVLEHIENDIMAMKECFRVLKKGGTAFFSVPLREEFSEDLSVKDPQKRLELYGKEDHVRWYNLEVLCKRLTSAGFDTSKISFPTHFPAELADAKLGDIFVLAQKPIN